MMNVIKPGTVAEQIDPEQIEKIVGPLDIKIDIEVLFSLALSAHPTIEAGLYIDHISLNNNCCKTFWGPNIGIADNVGINFGMLEIVAHLLRKTSIGIISYNGVFVRYNEDVNEFKFIYNIEDIMGV